MNIQALATEMKVSAGRIKHLARYLEKLGYAATESVLREAIAIMIDRNFNPNEAANKYASEQSVKQVKQNPEGNQDLQFGIVAGIEQLGEMHYQKTIGVYQQAIDHANAKAVKDAVVWGARGGMFLDENSKTTQVLKAFANFDGIKINDPEDFDIAQMALGGQDKSLPFFSVRSLTASKEPDQMETQTPEAQTVVESPQPVEA